MAHVLVPLPARDFDPTEAAVSWKLLRERGHRLSFATPDGQRAHADPLMVTGEGLDVWGRVPWLKRLVLVGRSLRADAAGRAAYAELERDPAFLAPLRHDALTAADFDALLLPGGHAPGMRDYLESPVLQRLVAAFFEADQPVAAVCHGVVLAARSVSPRSGRSVLHGRRTTALTWAFEQKAAGLGRLVRWWDPLYYRTYREQPGEPAGHWSVQAEVTRALASPADFLNVPAAAPQHFRKTSGLFRDRADDARPAFVVQDGRYLSARWPGDVHTFARTFADLLSSL
ncbi:MAG: type 1 glutamine amidotransferase domain-containing protein [Stagnimonas sp.]|nr:type 1 glutamine amidotransferase domain-containing protein [Stagnimonas sp.]